MRKLYAGNIWDKAKDKRGVAGSAWMELFA